jgi:hypothetical protein
MKFWGENHEVKQLMLLRLWRRFLVPRRRIRPLLSLRDSPHSLPLQLKKKNACAFAALDETMTLQPLAPPPPSACRVLLRLKPSSSSASGFDDCCVDVVDGDDEGETGGSSGKV